MAGQLKIGGNIIATHAGSEGAGTVTLDSSTLTIGSNTTVQGQVQHSALPAGSVLQTKTGLYQCSSDISIGTTSETYGPVISMVMKSENAKIFGLVNHGESYASLGTEEMKVSIAYKSSSFTAAQGNTSHGATSLNDTQIFFRVCDSSMSTVVANGTMSNGVGNTIYFAPIAFTTGGTGYVNYGGPHTNISLTIFEIKA